MLPTHGSESGRNRGDGVIDAKSRCVDNDVVHRVVILAFDGVQSLDVARPAEVFQGVKTFLSETGGEVATESAARLMTEPFDHVRGSIDTLVVAGGFSVWRHATDDRFTSRLTSLISRCDRLVTVCSGAALQLRRGCSTEIGSRRIGLGRTASPRRTLRSSSTPTGSSSTRLRCDPGNPTSGRRQGRSARRKTSSSTTLVPTIGSDRSLDELR